MMLNIDTTPAKSYCVNVLKAPVDVIAVYEDGTTETIATLNEVRQYTFIAVSAETRFIGGEIGKQVLPVPFNSAPAQNGSGGGSLTPDQEAALESVTDGSTVEALPDGAVYILKNGAAVQLSEYTDTLQLTPSALTTAQEMRVLYSPAAARTTPLIAVPDGATLHWAGDEEPTWEVGRDYVVQLLQTTPTHIDARLFNAPQGAKLPEVSAANWEALAKDESFDNVWPGYTEEDFLVVSNATNTANALLSAKTVILTGTHSINAPHADVYGVPTEGNLLNGSWWSKLICKNFSYFSNYATSSLNYTFRHQAGSHISGVYRLILPKVYSWDGGYIGMFESAKAVRDLRVYVPKLARSLWIGASAFRYFAQPLTAESVIYTLSHLKDLTLLPPDDAGEPVRYGVKIGIDATLGAIDPADGLWHPSHPGVKAAADEAQRKNWQVDFDYTEP